jgi:ethanolamine ammonia-lyase large subunit
MTEARLQSSRSRRAIWARGVVPYGEEPTPDQVARYRADEFIMNNIGKKTILEIRNWLLANGTDFDDAKCPTCRKPWSNRRHPG